VQANNEPNPTNTNAPRTIDCIYLRPFSNIQGGHELLDLRSGRVITRRRIKEIPVTDLVIQTVENMAIEQGLTTLKITGRNKLPIYPADWIAGVDYEHQDDANDDEEYNENNDDNENFEDINDEELYHRVDPTEVSDLIADSRNNDEGQAPNNNEAQLEEQ
jgi:hypothetical protein